MHYIAQPNAQRAQHASSKDARLARLAGDNLHKVVVVSQPPQEGADLQRAQCEAQQQNRISKKVLSPRAAMEATTGNHPTSCCCFCPYCCQSVGRRAAPPPQMHELAHFARSAASLKSHVIAHTLARSARSAASFRSTGVCGERDGWAAAGAGAAAAGGAAGRLRHGTNQRGS